VNASSKPILSVWQSLPAIAAFPARREILGQIAAYSVVRMITFLLGSAITIQWLPTFAISGDVAGISRALVGVLIELIVWILCMKLAVEALLNTAKDRLDPGKVGPEWASDDSAGSQILLLLCFLGPNYLLTLLFGASAGALALTVVIVCLPAAIIALTMDESLWRAFNPFAWLALVSRVGAEYFITVATLALLALLVFCLQHFIFANLPGWLDAVTSRFVSVYALVLAYHLMGYLLLAHHEQLGMDLTPPIARPVLANLEEDATMRQADALVTDGEADAAIAALQDLIHRRGASDPIHTRYRQLLIAKNDIARLSQHGREYVAVLLALGQDKHALALHLESRTLDPEYQLEVPEDITKLISYAVATGQSKLAVELAAGFDQRFPRNADVPQNTLAIARLMAERLGREVEAKQLLVGLVSRYPEHPLAAEIKLTLADVEQIVAMNARGPKSP
jgi:hypothetical protein